MFVFDEAHLIADGDRGWKLEETISFLHHLTKDSAHRIILLSAALGNEVHIAGWLNRGDGVLSRHEAWRGPRRLNVIYTTVPDWDNQTLEPASGTRQARERYPLKGKVYLQTAGDRRFVEGTLTLLSGSSCCEYAEVERFVIEHPHFNAGF